MTAEEIVENLRERLSVVGETLSEPLGTFERVIFEVRKELLHFSPSL